MELEQQLKGSRRESILLEWLTNSFHFPLANIFLELLVEGDPAYLLEIDLYALLIASVVQAWFLGTRKFNGRPMPLVGNLVGPALYTVIEVAEGGVVFFQDPYHWAYWIFSFAIGSIQQWRLAASGSRSLVLLEHLVRTNILLATYWMLEAHFDPASSSPATFFTDESHIFLTGVIFFLGLLVGGANLASERYLETLKRTAAQLRKYSEWLLGKEILSRAVDDPRQLALKRQQRSMLFLDIRGFTAWSERRPPEEVVGMLNDCFALAETVWSRRLVVKSKFTGDEVMLVLPDPEQALLTARELLVEVGGYLERHGLACGIGLHHGPLVEGLLGSSEVKAFDVIGDTVNTAKRICDHAGAGELLLSQAMFEQLTDVETRERRQISVKGKDAPLAVYLC